MLTLTLACGGARSALSWRAARDTMLLTVAQITGRPASTSTLFMAKYFLDRDGVPTGRIRGAVGQGHIDIANEILADRLQPGGHVYAQMFELGFVRVEEAELLLEVDAPRNLSSKQQAFLAEKARSGKHIQVNGEAFVRRRGGA